MGTKHDLRVVRTYKSLTEAFLQLMSKKHLEDITVNELCEKAMIRRTTFYKHFADKFDFFRFFVWQMQADFNAANPAPTNDQNQNTYYIKILHHVMDFFKEHEQFVRMVLSSNLLITILDILSEQIASDILEKIITDEKNGINAPAAPEIVTAFYTGSIMHTIRWWFVQKKPLPEEQLIQEVEKILMLCNNADCKMKLNS